MIARRTIRVSQLKHILRFMSRLQIVNPYQMEGRLQEIINQNHITCMNHLKDYLGVAGESIKKYMDLFDVTIEFFKQPDYWELKAAEYKFASAEKFKEYLIYWLVNGGKRYTIEVKFNLPCYKLLELISDEEIKQIRVGFNKGRTKNLLIPDLYDSTLDKPAPIRKLSKREVEELGYVTS